MNIDELQKNITGVENPVMVATELGFFIADGQADGSLSLYEAFLLKEAEFGLLQKGAKLPAWS